MRSVDEVVMMWEEINLVGSSKVVAAANEINSAVMLTKMSAWASEEGDISLARRDGGRIRLGRFSTRATF